MAAGRYDITIEEGVTFRKTITWKDAQGMVVPLTGYTAKLRIRKTFNTDSPVLVNLTTENGGIVLNPTIGQITFTVSAAASMLAVDQGRYSLVLTAPDGTVTRLLEGKVRVSPEVSF